MMISRKGMGDGVATRGEYFLPMVNEHIARSGASLVITLLNDDFVISNLEIPDSGNDSTVAELLLMLSTIGDHLLLAIRTQVNLRRKSFSNSNYFKLMILPCPRLPADHYLFLPTSGQRVPV